MSLFHTELLEILKNNENDRLREALSPSAADQVAPLSEIIENYSYMFGHEGVIPVERRLMESFSLKEFEELGLSRYFPRIYRGLPRVYRRDRPSDHHIKKNFTYLPGLKRLAVERAYFSLYKTVEVRGRICLFTWVIQDGLGDFMAGWEVRKLLQERFENLQVDWVVIGGRGLPEVDRVTQLREGEAFPDEVLKSMRECDLILQMPTFYPKTAELMDDLRKLESRKALPRMEILGEYGFLESSWFHPKSGNRSLGLHFLEKGILLRRQETKKRELENEKLKEWMSPNHRFYLAYLTTWEGGAIYLHALLKSLEHEEKALDICVPDLGWFVQYVEKQNALGRPVLEENFGVQSITVYFEGQMHSLSCAPTGKQVRLLCPGTLSKNDFQTLLHLSGDFVGVRGDQSFSEAVSSNKAFFYDGREHARYFIKDLLALAENRIPNHPATLTCFRGMGKAFLHHLPADEGEWVDETFFQEREPWLQTALEIGKALQDPQTIPGYKTLNRIIGQEHSANNHICHLVQRALHHQAHPQISAQESEQLSYYLSNEATFKDFIQSLKQSFER